MPDGSAFNERSFRVEFAPGIPFPALFPLAKELTQSLSDQKLLAGQTALCTRQMHLALSALCYAAMTGDPIAYPRGFHAYRNGSRLRDLGFTRKFVAVIDALDAAGYVRNRWGWYNRTRGFGAVTRVSPTAQLCDLFFEHMTAMPEAPISLFEAENCAETAGAADTVERMLDRHLGLQHHSVVTINHQRDDASSICAPLPPTRLQRRFADPEGTKGGRYYGGFWQNLPKAIRRTIQFNGAPTVELDFVAMHAHLIYAKASVPVRGDPHCVPDVPRSIAKLIFNVALNTSSPKAAKLAIQAEARKRDIIVNAQAFEKVIAHHAPVANSLFSDAWGWLQKIDSEIATQVITHFNDADRLVLPIHDSFIVSLDLRIELAHVMRQACLGTTSSWETPADVPVRLIRS